MAYGMAGMPGNRYRAGLPRGMGGFPAVGGGLGGLPVRKSAGEKFYSLPANAGSQLILDTTSSAGDCEVVALTPTTAIAIWNVAGAGYGCVLTITNGEVSKSASQLITGADTSFYHLNIQRISNTTALVTSRRDTPAASRQVGFVLTVVAGSLSVGSYYQYGANGIEAKTQSVALSETQAIAVDTHSSVRKTAYVLDISGSVISAAAGVEVDSLSTTDIEYTQSISKIDSTRALFCCRKFGTAATKVSVLTVSGSIVSNSTPVEVAYSSGAYAQCVCLTDTLAIIAYAKTSTVVGFRPIAIDGTTLTFGAETSIATSSTRLFTDLCRLTNKQFSVSWYESGAGFNQIITYKNGEFIFGSELSLGSVLSAPQMGSSTGYLVNVHSAGVANGVRAKAVSVI